MSLLALAIFLVPSRCIVGAEHGKSPLTPPAAVLQAEDARIAIMAKAKQAVVAVFAAGGQGGGSGVVITADGYALSNFHVVKPCGNAMKCGMADGRAYDAVVVGLDPTGDIALIKLLGRDDFPYAELADSDQVRVGDWAFAMGNPFLLATDFQPTVTYGIISGTHRYQYPSGTLLEYTDCIQTDASINPGNSGGPLFDSQGRLIGINGRCSFEKRGRVNVGVGYAISINQIKNFLGCLRSGRIIDHATLGAKVSSDAEGRVLISQVLETSDAYRRGLRDDDELLSFAGRAVSTVNGFKNVLGIFPKDWRVPLTFRREGKRHDAYVRLAGVHGKEELIQKTIGRPPMPPGEKPEPKGKTPKDAVPKAKRLEGKAPEKRPAPPMRMLVPAAPMPEIVKKHFEAKRGYANYYFNKLNQERVWNAWNGRARLSDARASWEYGGGLEGGAKYNFQFSDAGGLLRLPRSEVKWTAGDKLGTSLLPPESGGLMAALYLWRRLAVEGLQRFGEVYYQGTAPLPGYDGQADVLVGIRKDVECRFYFDPRQGDLLALEFFPEENADPCEVYFSGYRQVDGRWLPGRMEVRTGDVVYAVFKLEEFTFETSDSKVEKTEKKIEK